MPAKRTTRSKRSAPDSGNALVQINDRPIRDQAWLEHDLLEQRVLNMQTQLERHICQDTPRYDAWIRQRFGRLVARLEDARLELDEQNALRDSIRIVAREERISPTRAYQLVKARAGDFAPAHNRSNGQDDPMSFDEFMHQMQEEFLPNCAHKNRTAHQRTAIDAELTRRRQERARKLREAYRAVVRLLHPDSRRHSVHPGPTDNRADDLWLRAQDAYRRKDPTALELILARSERLRHGDTRQIPVSLIRALARQLSREADHLRRRLARCRRQPSWRFSERERLGPFARECGATLRRQLSTIEVRLRNVKAWIERVETQ